MAGKNVFDLNPLNKRNKSKNSDEMDRLKVGNGDSSKTVANGDDSIYDGNLASIDKVPQPDSEGKETAGDGAADEGPDSDLEVGAGKAGVLSKGVHGLINGTEKTGKNLAKGLKDYLNPMKAVNNVKHVVTAGTDKVADGLNIKKKTASLLIGSLAATTGLGGFMVYDNLTSRVKSDIIERGDEYVHECIVTNSEEDKKGGSSASGDDPDALAQKTIAIMLPALTDAGYDDEFVKAVASCWYCESHIIAARLESDFAIGAAKEYLARFGCTMPDSPYAGTPVDGDTAFSIYAEYGDGPYAGGGGNVNGGYMYEGHICPGIGLAQWTAGRGADLCKKVSAVQSGGFDYSVIDEPYQIAFAMSEWNDDDHLKVGGGYSGKTGEDLVRYVFQWMEAGGGSGGKWATMAEDRVKAYNDQVSAWVDAAVENAEYTSDVTSMAEILADASVGGGGSKVFEAALCMSTAHNELDSIPKIAYSLSYVIPLDYTSAEHAAYCGGDTTATVPGGTTTRANRLDAPRIVTAQSWPTKKGSKSCFRACTEYYVLAHYLCDNKITLNLNFNTDSMEEDKYLASCDRTTATIIRAAGADDRFVLGDPEAQIDYVYIGAGGKWDTVPSLSTEDPRYCGYIPEGDEDHQKLWDATGVINGRFYYPYTTSASFGVSSILISSGTTGGGGVTGAAAPGGGSSNGLGHRIDNNFMNILNTTTDHIITYSGSAALKAYYIDKFGENILLKYWWTYEGAPAAKYPNKSTQAQYDTLLMDDAKLGFTTYMTDANGNKSDMAEKANDKYESFYTQVKENYYDKMGDGESIKQNNQKTGLMNFRSRGEIYCDFIELLEENDDYDRSGSDGYTFKNPSGETFVDGDPAEDTCRNLSDLAESPYSWPKWKINTYVDLVYRYQQMLRFAEATQYASLPSEQDTDICRTTEQYPDEKTYRGDTGTETSYFYVYMYGHRGKEGEKDKFDDKLYFDVDKSEVLWDEASELAWYYGRTFKYRDMVSNDMLQDLLQTTTAIGGEKDPDEFWDEYDTVKSFVSSVDSRYAKEAESSTSGYKYLVCSSQRQLTDYGLTKEDWQLVLQYYNLTNGLDMDKLEETFSNWFNINIGLCDPARWDETRDQGFKLDRNHPFTNNYINALPKKNGYSGDLTKADIKTNDLKWMGVYLYTHYYPNTAGLVDHYTGKIDGDGERIMWAVYTKVETAEGLEPGDGFPDLDSLARFYKNEVSDYEDVLKNITLYDLEPTATITLSSKVYNQNKFTYMVNDPGSDAKDLFTYKVLDPHKYFEQHDDGLNTNAAVEEGGFRKKDQPAIPVSLPQHHCDTHCPTKCNGDNAVIDSACDEYVSSVNIGDFENYEKYITENGMQGQNNLTIIIKCDCGDDKCQGTYAITMNNPTKEDYKEYKKLIEEKILKEEKLKLHKKDGTKSTISISLFTQAAHYKGADGSPVMSEDIHIDPEALAGNLEELSTKPYPIYVRIPYSGSSLQSSVHEGRGAVIIDSEYNPYESGTGSYSNLTSSASVIYHIQNVKTALHTNMQSTGAVTIFGMYDYLQGKFDDWPKTEYSYDIHMTDKSSIKDLTQNLTTDKVNGRTGPYIMKIIGCDTKFSMTGTEGYNEKPDAASGVAPGDSAIQHVMFTGLAGKVIGTYKQVDDPAGGDEKINTWVKYTVDESSFFDKELDEKNEAGEHLSVEEKAALQVNDAIKTRINGQNGAGYWMTDGSIGTHGAQSDYRMMDERMKDHTYRLFSNIGCKDIDNIDEDYEMDLESRPPKYKLDEDTGDKIENDSEAFIYGVISDRGYYLYDDSLKYDEEKVCGQGDNSYYSRLMHIWNDYETLLESNRIHPEDADTRHTTE